MKTDNEKIGLITFGLGGHHEYNTNPVEKTESGLTIIHNGVSGYDRPETFTAEKRHEGALVIDYCQLLERKPSLAVLSPLCRNDKPFDKCPQVSPMFAAAIAGNEYGALLNIHKKHQEITSEPGPLDGVDIVTFFSWWKTRGARTGKIQNGNIIWDKN